MYSNMSIFKNYSGVGVKELWVELVFAQHIFLQNLGGLTTQIFCWSV